jgi:hypothetical protein
VLYQWVDVECTPWNGISVINVSLKGTRVSVLFEGTPNVYITEIKMS